MSPLLCYKSVPCYIYQSPPGLGSSFCPYIVHTKVNTLISWCPGFDWWACLEFSHRIPFIATSRVGIFSCVLSFHSISGCFRGLLPGSVPAQIIPKPASWGSSSKNQRGFSRCKLEDVQNKGVCTNATPQAVTGKRVRSWWAFRTKLAGLRQRSNELSSWHPAFAVWSLLRHFSALSNLVPLCVYWLSHVISAPKA